MYNELLRKFKACRSEKEVRQFLSDNKKELDDLSLEMVSGGASADDFTETPEEQRKRREEESQQIDFLLDMLRRLCDLKNNSGSDTDRTE